MAHSASLHTQPGSAKTVADILTAAADLIEPEGRWTQQEGARTPEGHGVQANHPRASSWDIIGAIHKVSQTMVSRSDDMADRAKNFMLAHIGNLATYNDAPSRTQAEVVAALRAAALRAAAEKARTPAADTQVGTSNASEPKNIPTNGDSQ